MISPLRIGWKKEFTTKRSTIWCWTSNLRSTPAWIFGDEAEDLILRQSNLTCGTMAGILNHPWSRRAGASPKTPTRPTTDWDLLIVDEASKTTFQQFVIPAAFSKRWILVGDVRQLPPFLEASELMTNLVE